MEGGGVGLLKKLLNESKAPRSELMDELNLCRKDSSIIKEKHINLFGRFIVYGLATIQRDSNYPIACVPVYSRNLFLLTKQRSL